MFLGKMKNSINFFVTFNLKVFYTFSSFNYFLKVFWMGDSIQGATCNVVIRPSPSLFGFFSFYIFLWAFFMPDCLSFILFIFYVILTVFIHSLLSVSQQYLSLLVCPSVCRFVYPCILSVCLSNFVLHTQYYFLSVSVSLSFCFRKQPVIIANVIGIHYYVLHWNNTEGWGHGGGTNEGVTGNLWVREMGVILGVCLRYGFGKTKIEGAFLSMRSHYFR